MELLGHMVVLFLVFGAISILFSTVAALIYIPTNSVQMFLFLHILRFLYFKIPDALALVWNTLLAVLIQSGTSWDAFFFSVWLAPLVL